MGASQCHSAIVYRAGSRSKGRHGGRRYGHCDGVTNHISGKSPRFVRVGMHSSEVVGGFEVGVSPDDCGECREYKFKATKPGYALGLLWFFAFHSCLIFSAALGWPFSLASSSGMGVTFVYFRSRSCSNSERSFFGTAISPHFLRAASRCSLEVKSFMRGGVFLPRIVVLRLAVVVVPSSCTTTGDLSLLASFLNRPDVSFRSAAGWLE